MNGVASLMAREQEEGSAGRSTMGEPGAQVGLESCLRSLSVPVCALDGSLRCQLLNPAAFDLFRLPDPAPSVASFIDHVHPLDRASMQSALEVAFREDRPTILSCRVGRERAWSLVDLHLGNPASDGLRLAVMLPKRFSAPTLNQSAASDAARAAAVDDQAEEWRRFAYTVAHDLKVPLVTMESNLRLIQQDLEAGRVQSLDEDLAEVDGAVQKMKRLVVELLELARIGRLDLIAAAHSRETEEVDLNSVVDRVAREILAGNPGWNGSFKRLDPLPVVRGRGTQLTEVFQNLIDNAVKYSAGAESPRVEVGCLRESGGALIFVRDNGCGVPPHDRHRVFDLFVQLRPDAGGVGIGLPIVRSVISSHGGRVWVDDGIDGQGASFYLDLNSLV